MSRERDEADHRGGDDAERERPPAWDDGASPHGSESEADHDLQRLRELFLSAGAPEPTDAAWRAVQARIDNLIPGVRTARRRASRPVWAILGLTAAAVLAGVLLTRSWWAGGGAIPTPEPEEPYPVVAADDVDIISMDGRDVASLVVGEPPVSGELVFVKLEDVRVIECKRCPKCGNKGRLEQGEVPMVVVAAGEGGADEE